MVCLIPADLYSSSLKNNSPSLQVLFDAPFSLHRLHHLQTSWSTVILAAYYHNKQKYIRADPCCNPGPNLNPSVTSIARLQLFHWPFIMSCTILKYFTATSNCLQFLIYKVGGPGTQFLATFFLLFIVNRLADPTSL